MFAIYSKICLFVPLVFAVLRYVRMCRNVCYSKIMFVCSVSRLSDRGILSGGSDVIMDSDAITLPIKQLEKEISELQRKLNGTLSTSSY